MNSYDYRDGSTPLIADVIRETARAYGMTEDDLTGPRRSRRYAWPRHIAMMVARHHTCRSWDRIGKVFNRDHSSIIHGVRRATQRCATHPRTNAKAQRILLTLEVRAVYKQMQREQVSA